MFVSVAEAAVTEGSRDQLELWDQSPEGHR